MGHYASDPDCPARAPEAIAATVKPFHGSANPLSNLHECPEGCIIPDGNHDFSSSEQHYQFKRLRHHRLIDESYQVLEADSGFDAMKLVHRVLPEDDVQPSWKSIALDEMLNTNRLKYQNCPHAKETLMNTKVVLAEATSNVF